MPVTVKQAKDQICKVLKDAIAASGSYNSILVLWPNVKKTPPLSTGTPCLRLSIRHSDGGKATLRGDDGTRYTRHGLLTCQIFTVINSGDTVQDELTDLVLAAYEQHSATPSGVWYRNAHPEDVESGGWDQVNVLAEFEYDTVRT